MEEMRRFGARARCAIALLGFGGTLGAYSCGSSSDSGLNRTPNRNADASAGASGTGTDASITGSGGQTSTGTCRNSLDCATRKDGLVICDTRLGTCVECAGSNDCDSGNTCVGGFCRPPCTSDRQCTPMGLLCNQTAGVCVACIVNGDCPAPESCTAGACRASAPAGNGGAGGAAGGGNAGSPPSTDACAPEPALPVVVYRDASFVDTVTVYAPTALFFMLDRSGSMVTGFPVGSAHSWSDVTGALGTFLADPKSKSLDAGLGFFPPVADSGAAACDGSDCGRPVVEIGPVPSVATQIASAMASSAPQPINLTPTECALRGMINHCIAYTKSTGEQCVAVLLTDGSPTQCDTTTQDLVNIVADGKAKGVSTFTVGIVGAELSFLDPIAAAGGTTAAIDAMGGESSVVAALDLIRDKAAGSSTHEVVTPGTVGTTLPCEWGIPAPPPNQIFDPRLLNLEITSPDGGVRAIPAVSSASACAGDGWYYDDPAKPARIVACPGTCDALKAAPGTKVEVVFACSTGSP